MNLYTRPQLALVLAFALAAGAGYGVAVWRRAYPELAGRLEQFDRRVAPDAPAATGLAAAAPRPSATGVAAATIGGEQPEQGSGTERIAQARARSRRSDPALEPVDLNRASAEELARLPGIGRMLAARIVETRDADGRFASVDDLRRVPGLGRARVERLRGRVVSE
jgi:competence protein ComEA